MAGPCARIHAGSLVVFMDGPAIGSVFSGLWQYGHGAGQMPSSRVESGVTTLTPVYKPTALYADVPLLAEAAGEAGFHTAVISASPWTNTSDNPVGLVRGFEEILTIGQNGSGRGFAKMQEALTLKEGDTPFFHYMHFMEAHDWHMVPEPKLDARIANFAPEERALFLQAAPPDACKNELSLVCKRYLVYASAVVRLRETIATLLRKMENQKLLDDTVVVLFSDHGERFGDHYHDDRIARVIRDMPERFIGHGHSMYQELVHVPLLVWHSQYEGKVIDELVSLVDIAPTVARWLGIEFTPAQWPGFYLSDYIEPSARELERVAYASGIVRGEQQISALKGTNKSIWYMVADEYSYFDLANDPYELHSEPSDSLMLLFDGLFMDYMQGKRNIKSGTVTFSEKQLESLQAIGYLQGLDADSSDAEE